MSENKKILFITFILLLAVHNLSRSSAAAQSNEPAQTISVNSQTIIQSTEALAAFAKQQAGNQKQALQEIEKRKAEIALKTQQIKKMRDAIAQAKIEKEKAVQKASIDTTKKLLLAEFTWRYDILKELNRISEYYKTLLKFKRSNEFDDSEIDDVVRQLLSSYSGPELAAFKEFLIKIEKSELLPKPIKK